MNVTLRPEIESFVRSQVESGSYANADELVHAALREYQTQVNLTEDPDLERALLEGLDSPLLEEMSEADWKGIRERALSRIKAK